MQLLLNRVLVVGSGVIIGLGILPAYAQISDRQVDVLVEALRQAAPQTGSAEDGLYSDWQVLPNNIPRWSESCIGRMISPSEFDADPGIARDIITCVMQDVLREEYRNSGSDEAVAVRRSAAWWMTGDPTRYDSGDTASYTQQVFSLYQQQLNSTTAPSQPQAESIAPSEPQPSVYDRYMEAGYTATEQRDYETALLYFKRALDERPGDIYAQQAIQNVEGYLTQP